MKVHVKEGNRLLNYAKCVITERKLYDYKATKCTSFFQPIWMKIIPGLPVNTVCQEKTSKSLYSMKSAI